MVICVEIQIIYIKRKFQRYVIKNHIGFQIPDEFGVGYGLDYAQRYRNLRCIGVLKSEQQPT